MVKWCWKTLLQKALFLEAIFLEVLFTKDGVHKTDLGGAADHCTRHT